ncbi:hypothetical protein M3Y96_00148500 [Aphelenchoides besseyi]|nr:hypothetical protein M3Y96_00148500 [Aphelenchoides besseyi]
MYKNELRIIGFNRWQVHHRSFSIQRFLSVCAEASTAHAHGSHVKKNQHKGSKSRVRKHNGTRGGLRKKRGRASIDSSNSSDEYPDDSNNEDDEDDDGEG